MTRTSDVAVLGAGIVGLATAHALRERGASVHVYEPGTPGDGQSGGNSRVFRHAHDDPRLVALACESRAIYGEWEDVFGMELVSADGVLSLGPAALRRLPLLRRAGVDAMEVGRDELAERMPLLERYEGPAIFDADGGSIRAASAVGALVDRLDDCLVADEVVALWPTRRSTIEVRSASGRGEHGAAIVCAGSGTASLARGLGVWIPLELSLHGRVTFTLRNQQPRRIACLLDGSDVFGETGVYGAASPGSTRFSLGVNGAAEAREDQSLVHPCSLASVTARAEAYVRRALPGLNPEPAGYRHCWVTELPWHADAFAVWKTDGMLLVAGANLFKHAPALGRALAEATLGGELNSELEPAARLGEPTAAAQRSSFSSSS